MGIENFGIDIQVTLNDNEAKSSIIELTNQLQTIKNLGEKGLTIDLGLSGTNAETIKSMINLVKNIGKSDFKHAFEVSDKSISSLVEIRKVAQQIGKLSEKQVEFFNVQKAQTEANGLLKQYQAIQGEIKKLQSQMSRTTDNQVLVELGKQLDERYAILKSKFKEMNELQKISVGKIDKKNLDDLEQIYGKVFDAIQKKARSFGVELSKLSNNKMVNTSELEKTKKLLEEITNLKFKEGQVEGFKPLSDSFKKLEQLKLSISDLNKSTKLDGFNQSDDVKQWKNLYNIIQATKKEMAKSTNPTSIMSYSSKVQDLTNQLNECYKRMSEVDKKTVDTLKNFGNVKMDTFFTKNADNIVKQAQKIENSLMNLGKNSFTDKSKLNEYQNKVREIIQTMNGGILEKTLNEFNIPFDKRNINDIKLAMQDLANESKRALKIDDFVSGMNTQLSAMKMRFKDALPDKEIARIQKSMKSLKNTSLDELPVAFRKINNEVQLLRANTQETAKSFNQFNKVDEGLNKLVSQYDRLMKAQALNKEEAQGLWQSIEKLFDKSDKIKLFDKNSISEISSINKEILELNSQMQSIKMPNVLTEWKRINTELNKYKKQLSTVYEEKTFDALTKNISNAEKEMESLVKRMNSQQLSEMFKVDAKSDRDLQNYFRNQADGSIKALDTIELKIKDLFDNKFIDGNILKSLLDDINRMKGELKTGISTGLIDPLTIQESKAQINGLNNSINELEINAKQSFDNASKSIKDYTKCLRELENAHINLAKAQSSDGISQWMNKIDTLKSKLKELYKGMSSDDKVSANNILGNFDDSLNTKLLSQVDKMYKQAEKLKSTLSGLFDKDFMNTSQLDTANKKVDEIFNSLRNLDKLDGEGLSKLGAYIREVTTEVNSLDKVGSFAQKIINEIERLEQSCNSPALASRINEIKSALTGLLNMPVGSNNIERTMNSIQNSMRRVQQTTTRTRGFFVDLYDSMRTYTLGNMLGNSLIGSGREALTVIKDLDKAIVDMTRVAPKDFVINTENLDVVREKASAIGKEVGKSSAEVITAMGEAMRVGAKNIKDAEEIAKQTTIFSNVADLDQKEASTTVNAVLSAFGGIKNALSPVRGEVKGATKDYTNLQHAMDLINFSGNNFAISSGGVAEALKRFGSVAHSYGNSLVDTVAMITATNESIQDPEQVGSGLKTIQIRLAGLKTSLKDGQISTNKTAKALKEIAGIDIFEDKKQTKVKDMFTILNELNKVWGNLNEKQQLGLGEALGGAQRANVLQSLLNNWKQVLKFKEEYNRGNVVGSSARENAIYMNSIEGKLNALKQNIRDIIDTLMSSDMFKGLIDGATAVTGAIANIIKQLDKMKLATPVALMSLVALFKTIKTLGTGEASIGLIGTALGLGKGLGGVGTEVATTTGLVGRLGVAFKGLNLGTTLASVGMSVLSGVITTGVIVALAGGIKLVYDWINANKKAQQQAEESLRASDQKLGAYKEEKEDLQNLGKEYDKLSKKKSKSQLEEERMTEIANDLAKKYPDLVKGMDEFGTPIIDINNLDEALKKMDELIQKQERLSRQKKIEVGDKAIKENENRINTKKRTNDFQIRDWKTGYANVEKSVRQLLSVENELNKVYSADTFEKKKKALGQLQKAYEDNAKAVENNYAKGKTEYEKYASDMEKGQTGVYNRILSRNENLSEEQKKLGEKITKAFDYSRFDENTRNSLTNIIGKGLEDNSFEKNGALEYITKIANAQAELKKTGNPYEYMENIDQYIPSFAKLLGISEELAKEKLAPDNFFYQAQNEMDAYMRTFGKTVGNTDESAKKIKKNFEEIVRARDILSNNANYVQEANGEVILNQKVVRQFIEDPNINEKLRRLMNDLNQDGKVTEQEVDLITRVNAKMEKGKGGMTPQDYLELQNQVNMAFGKNHVSADVYIDPQYILPDMKDAFKDVDNLSLDVEATVKIKTAIAKGDLNTIVEELNYLPVEKKIDVIANIGSYMESMGLISKQQLKDKLIGIVANDLASKKISEVEAKKIREKILKITGVDNGATNLINKVNGAKDKTITVTVIGRQYGLNMGTINALKNSGYIKSNEVVPQEVPNDFSTQVSMLNNSISAKTLDMQTEVSEKPISTFDIPVYTNDTSNNTTSTDSSNVSMLLYSKLTSSNSTTQSNLAITGKDIGDAMKYDIDLLTELNNAIKMVTNQLSNLDTKMEKAIGEQKIEYLQQQIDLYKKQQNLLTKQIDGLQRQKNYYDYFLKNKGFSFDIDGNMTNYEEKLLEMEKQVADLEAIANKDKSTDKQKTQYDNAKKNLEEIKKYLDAYNKIAFDELPQAKDEWDKLNNSIMETSMSLDYAPVDDIDKQIERADEEELVGLLEKKLGLLEELKSKKQEYIDLLNKEKSDSQKTLTENGITFNDKGNMTNFQDKIKQLEGTLNNTKDAKTKENIRKKIEEITKASEKYVKVTKATLPQATEEWLEAKDKIKDTEKELEDIKKQQEKFLEDRAEAVSKATEDIMKINQDLIKTQIDINKLYIEMSEKSMKLASFDPTQSYESLEKQISLLEEQLTLQKRMGEELEKQKKYYQDRLVTYGIKFDDKGFAKNSEEILSKIRDQMASASDSDELEKLKKKFDEIVETLGKYNGSLEDIIGNQNSLTDIQLQIEGVYENMLQTTKKVEEKITQILTKQVEERKKLIDEEAKKRIDALKKEQEAYNKSKEENKYNEDYNEKLDEIMKLQSQIEAVSKDTTLTGKAKLADLLKELAEKQKAFDDFVQDKLDKDINDKYQSEQDKVQEEADKKKEELDKILEKENMAVIIKDALSTGTIKDIDGNILNLKQAIFDYEDKYGDGLSVVGGLIKKDLLSQLDISLDTMKNIESILKKLNISDLSKFMTFSLPDTFKATNTNNYTTHTINFNESLITVKGNVDNGVLPQLKDMIKQAEKEITRNIIKSM